MGVFWNSKAEVLTNKNKNAQDIFYWLKSNFSLNEISIKDCSVLFSSYGYGSFGSIEEDSDNGNFFQKICGISDCEIIKYKEEDETDIVDGY